MRIAYENIIDDLNASTLTALTTATGYSILDVQDQRLTTQWRSGSFVVGASAQTITIDFGSAKKINTVAILGHDLSLGEFQNIQRLGSEIYVQSLASLGSGIVIAGTAATGQIYRSLDSGSSWTNIQRLGSETQILSLVSLGSGIVIAGTYPTGQIYRSLDSGSSWTNIQRLGSETQILSLVSLGSGIVIAGTGATGQIYRSLDSGSSWTNIQRLGSETYVYSLASLGSGIVIAGTATTGQIYRSLDSGSSWANIQRLGSETYVNSLASLGSGIVIAGTATTGQIYRSLDSGSSWTNIQRLGSETYVNSLASLGSGIVIAGTATTGQIYRSLDSGSSWTNIQRLGSETQVPSLVSLGSGIVIAGTGATGQIYKSELYITIMGNAVNSWTAPSVIETLSWNEGAILKFITDAHYQYWRFSIANSSNSNGYVQIGRLWLGDYITIDPSSLLDFKVIKKRSDQVIYGRNRQKWANIGVGWRQFTFNFPPTQEATLQLIQNMYDTVGNHSSFIFCNFDTIRDYKLVEPCYVSINGDLTFSHDNRMKFTYQLIMEEDK